MHPRSPAKYIWSNEDDICHVSFAHTLCTLTAQGIQVDSLFSQSIESNMTEKKSRITAKTSEIIVLFLLSHHFNARFYFDFFTFSEFA